MLSPLFLLCLYLSSLLLTLCPSPTRGDVPLSFQAAPTHQPASHDKHAAEVDITPVSQQSPSQHYRLHQYVNQRKSKYQNPRMKLEASPMPSECSSRPYDFGSYSYCEAGFPRASSYSVPSGYTLVNVQLITRHGDRTPVNIMPSYSQTYDFCNRIQTLGVLNDPPNPVDARLHKKQHKHKKHGKQQQDNNEGRRLLRVPVTLAPSTANPFGSQFWQGNCMNGQLTARGMDQLKRLGESIRDIYVNNLNFLAPVYDDTNTTMYVRSTDVWRTQQSAESLLTGLYPTQNVIATGLVPIFNYPEEIETMYANPSACDALADLMVNQRASPPWLQHLDDAPLWNALNDILDTTDSSPDWHDTYDHYYDNFAVLQCHNMPLPCSATNSSYCVTPDMQNKVINYCDWEYAYLFTEDQWLPFAQLGIGGFMSVIRDVLAAWVNNNPNLSTIGAPTFAYYSGHDSTIAAVLGALNITGWRWPPYASNIIFELWKSSSAAAEPTASSYSVRMLYNGDVIPLQSLGCCDELCPYENVVEWLNMVVPENLVELCQPEGSQKSAAKKNKRKL